MPVPLSRGPAPARYFYPLFEFFRFAPFEEGNQNLPPPVPPFKKGEPNYLVHPVVRVINPAPLVPTFSMIVGRKLDLGEYMFPKKLLLRC